MQFRPVNLIHLPLVCTTCQVLCVTLGYTDQVVISKEGIKSQMSQYHSSTIY